jgi:hypothetical protein
MMKAPERVDEQVLELPLRPVGDLEGTVPGKREKWIPGSSPQNRRDRQSIRNTRESFLRWLWNCRSSALRFGHVRFYLWRWEERFTID